MLHTDRTVIDQSQSQKESNLGILKKIEHNYVYFEKTQVNILLKDTSNYLDKPEEFKKKKCTLCYKMVWYKHADIFPQTRIIFYE